MESVASMAAGGNRAALTIKMKIKIEMKAVMDELGRVAAALEYTYIFIYKYTDIYI